MATKFVIFVPVEIILHENNPSELKEIWNELRSYGDSPQSMIGSSQLKFRPDKAKLRDIRAAYKAKVRQYE